MSLYKHWNKYPPVHIAMGLRMQAGREQQSTALEDAMFSGEGMPFDCLPLDVQQFIKENR